MKKYSDQKEISEKLRLINITVEDACSANAKRSIFSRLEFENE